jgi:hypothetical protein
MYNGLKYHRKLNANVLNYFGPTFFYFAFISLIPHYRGETKGFDIYIHIILYECFALQQQ